MNKKIGNIVTFSKKGTFNDLFNVVNTLDECIPGIPTLLIGWSNVKSLYPDISILDKEYNGIYWSFSKTERRCDYEDDIINFYNMCILNVMNDIKYVYIDLMKYSLTSIKKVIKFLKSNKSKLIFLTKESHFAFIYSEDYKTVFGISLTTAEYLGINKKKILRLIRNSKYINNTSFLDSDLRKIINNNTHYILPLYSYFKK